MQKLLILYRYTNTYDWMIRYERNYDQQNSKKMHANISKRYKSVLLK